MATTYQAKCPSCGRGIGATTVGQVSKPGSVKLLRHLPGDGTKDWCPGSGVLVEQFDEVETAKSAARRPIGRDGVKGSLVCYQCKRDIPTVGYWRGILPGLPAGGFVAICGPECPSLGEVVPFEQFTGPRFNRKVK